VRRLVLSATLAAATLAGAAGQAAAAATPARSGVDHRAGVTIALQGSRLEARILAGPGRAKLQGRRVSVACAPRYPRSPTGTDAKDAGLVTSVTARWPKGRSRLTVTLPRDLSADARWCLVETRDGDVALVDFALGTNPYE
jgi:hypothetical protein